jgi:hypothetical protein
MRGLAGGLAQKKKKVMLASPFLRTLHKGLGLCPVQLQVLPGLIAAT